MKYGVIYLCKMHMLKVLIYFDMTYMSSNDAVTRAYFSTYNSRFGSFPTKT